MAEDDQARARHGGLDMEITVEEPPARVKRASEPSGPVQTDAAEPEEPSPEDTDEGPGGDGDARGGNRLTDLVGKLRDKARREKDEAASHEDDVSPDPDSAAEPERAEDRPAVRASGFTILSYRSGPGQNGDPPIPGRQGTTPPHEEAAAEVAEPEPVDEAPEDPETSEIEQPDPGMTEAPPVPADDIETSDPEDQVAIEMEEPTTEVVEPDQAPEEEALEAQEEPEAEEPADSPGLFTRLRSKLSRSKADAIEVPTAMPAPPPTPPLATAEVEVAEEPEEGEDRPGLFARLTGKASKEEDPEPEQEPEPGPATAEEPAKKAGLFSRLKEKVSGSDQEPEDQAADEPEEAPTPTTSLKDPHDDAVEGGPEVPPTGDRHPELIAAMSTETETVEDPEEPDTVDADTGEEPAKKGGLFSRLKDKVAGSEEADDQAEVDRSPEPEETPEPPAVAVGEPEPAVAEDPEPEAVDAEEPPEPATVEAEKTEPVAPEIATDQLIDEALEADGDLPYEEIVRRVEILLESRREDPEKSAAREKVRILAGGSKR